MLLEAPAEIRPSRKVLFHRANVGEPNSAPEPRHIGILLLHDQPDVATARCANPLLHRTPYPHAQPLGAVIRRKDEEADIPVGFVRIALEKIHDRDERAAALKPDDVPASQLHLQRA